MTGDSRASARSAGSAETAGSAQIPAELAAAVRALAARPRLLLALDFDGVLAPIVRDPEAARPLPAAADALSRLARRPAVRLALVSGRTLDDLRRLAAPPPGTQLVGSHGAQFDRVGTQAPGQAAPAPPLDPAAPNPPLDPAAGELLARVTAALEQISAGHPGTFVEHKPAGAVLHTRQADRPVAARAAELAVAGPAGWPGVYPIRGKEVVDLSVVDTSKGAALDRLRTEAGLPRGGGGVLYAGDDVTDERAFAVLDDGTGDVTVKVGPGETAARHRVPGPPEVAALLDLLDSVLPPSSPPGSPAS